MQKLISILLLVFLFSFSGKIYGQEGKSGLLIVDAQKWFIPGHPESLYERWNIKGHDRGAKELIASMDSVLVWANAKQLPVFVTYEGSDTGQFDIPDELKSKLYAPKTTHYVKLFYGATKHPEFNKMVEDSGIRNWIVIGAETDVCVYQTVKELLKKKMKVTLVTDAIYSGRNNTEVALNNLISFGASTIRVSDLYKGTPLFRTSPKEVEKDISYNDVVITVFTTDVFSQEAFDKANLIRLQYLKDYAQIVGIPIEIISEDSTIKTYYKTRLVAGNLTEEQYKRLRRYTKDPLVVVSDCITLPSSKQPASWPKRTLKMVFYELMETAAFYGTPIEELEGWQKELKKAMKDGKLDYVEMNQNLQ